MRYKKFMIDFSTVMSSEDITINLKTGDVILYCEGVETPLGNIKQKKELIKNLTTTFFDDNPERIEKLDKIANWFYKKLKTAYKNQKSGYIKIDCDLEDL